MLHGRQPQALRFNWGRIIDPVTLQFLLWCKAIVQYVILAATTEPAPVQNHLAEITIRTNSTLKKEATEYIRG